MVQMVLQFGLHVKKALAHRCVERSPSRLDRLGLRGCTAVGLDGRVEGLQNQLAEEWHKQSSQHTERRARRVWTDVRREEMSALAFCAAATASWAFSCAFCTVSCVPLLEEEDEFHRLAGADQFAVRRGRREERRRDMGFVFALCFKEIGKEWMG